MTKAFLCCLLVLCVGLCSACSPAAPVSTPVPMVTATPMPTEAPTPEPTPTAAPTPEPDPLAVTQQGDQLEVPQTLMDYFMATCIGAEYGDAREFIIRWEQPQIVLELTGDYDARQQARVEEVAAHLSSLPNLPHIRLAEPGEVGDMLVQFAPYDAMDTLLGYPNDDCFGFVEVFYEDYVCNRAYVGIANDISEADQDHAILEELTQALGPVQDSYLYPDSIFCQDYSTVDTMLAIDEAVVSLLYHPHLYSGMTAEDIYGCCTIRLD